MFFRACPAGVDPVVDPEFGGISFGLESPWGPQNKFESVAGSLEFLLPPSCLTLDDKVDTSLMSLPPMCSSQLDREKELLFLRRLPPAVAGLYLCVNTNSEV